MARDIEPVGAPRINAVPSGLLALLGIQNGGRYPEWMPNVLQPVIDLTDWYLTTEMEVQAPAANAVNALGNFDVTAGSLRVPNNELWYVVGYSVATNGAIAAGQACRFRASWQPAGAGGFNALVGPSVTVAATELGRTQTLQSFWAGPGSGFAGVLEQLTAGPISFVGTVAFKRLRV